jgi:hypothetical protein
MAMKVQVLYFEDCPNRQPAVRLASDVMAELGLDTEVEEVEVKGPDDARRLRFLGSPTVVVDGIDIEPAARSRTDFGFCCRTYGGEVIHDRDAPPTPARRCARCAAPGGLSPCGRP